MNKRFLLGGLALVILASGILGACDDWYGDVEEPPLFDLIDLMAGSAGYEGDGAILGLRGGERYLLKHEKKETTQERDPFTGKIRIYPVEDWYVVDASGGLAKIAASTSDIPSVFETEALNNGTSEADRDHKILSLANGEKYGAYFYGRPNPGDRVVRLRSTLTTAPLATFTLNAVLNIRHFVPGNKVLLADNIANGAGSGGYQTYSQLFNDNNHMVVLVGTSLHLYEFPRTFGGNTGANLRIRGYDYDIIVECGDFDLPVSDPTYPYLLANHGNVTVEAIVKEGQTYFVMTATEPWRGKIHIDWHL